MNNLGDVIKNNKLYSTSYSASLKNKESVLDIVKQKIDTELTTQDFYFDNNFLYINLLPPQKYIYKINKKHIFSNINKVIKIKNIKITNW